MFGLTLRAGIGAPLERCTRPPTAASARTAPPRGGRFVDLLLNGTGSRDGEAIACGTAPRAVRALASLFKPNRRATQ